MIKSLSKNTLFIKKPYHPKLLRKLKNSKNKRIRMKLMRKTIKINYLKLIKFKKLNKIKNHIEKLILDSKNHRIKLILRKLWGHHYRN